MDSLEHILIAMRSSQIIRGFDTATAGRPCTPRNRLRRSRRIACHVGGNTQSGSQRLSRDFVTTCQATDSAIADSSAEKAGDELETFETHVGMVEPVDEDDAEVDA